ncbi:MAG: DUF262 domain-containing protein [Rhodospirillales bacterium]|nr:DUF262 domain-containing protein [Rhodospirillales bacterium]
MALTSAADLTLQLSDQRRLVDFDTSDIQLQQLITMLDEGQILVAPAYQRQFRWGDARCSELIESLLLGIPVPNLFMATNPDDNTWEVVDGLQRLCTVAKFMANDELLHRLNIQGRLTLTGLKKLTEFNMYSFNKLPSNIQQHIRTRSLRVVTLNDKSSPVVRIDLFERLNTGGIILTPQEIRSAVFHGTFAEKLDELRDTQDFRTVVRLTEKQRIDGTAEECVLRFFAFLEKYKLFEHSVGDFLNKYMQESNIYFEYERLEPEFRNVFSQLVHAFPEGIQRPHRKGTTPLNLYEGVVVGAALAIRERGSLVIDNLSAWMNTDTLRSYTTGATNDRRRVEGRIEYCRDRFLGRPNVQALKE